MVIDPTDAVPDAPTFMFTFRFVVKENGPVLADPMPFVTAPFAVAKETLAAPVADEPVAVTLIVIFTIALPGAAFEMLSDNDPEPPCVPFTPHTELQLPPGLIQKLFTLTVEVALFHVCEKEPEAACAGWPHVPEPPNKKVSRPIEPVVWLNTGVAGRSGNA